MRVEPGREHALADQVEVLGVLHHRAGGDLAEALALQLVAFDQPAQCGGHHLLVADAGVGAVGAGERDARAADHGDAAHAGAN